MKPFDPAKRTFRRTYDLQKELDRAVANRIASGVCFKGAVDEQAAKIEFKDGQEFCVCEWIDDEGIQELTAKRVILPERAALADHFGRSTLQPVADPDQNSYVAHGEIDFFWG